MHESFNADRAWIAEHRAAYREGRVGDVAIKKKLIEVLDAFLEPIRTRRAEYAARPDDVLAALQAGTRRANAVAEETLALAKKAMRQDDFPRTLVVP